MKFGHGSLKKEVIRTSLENEVCNRSLKKEFAQAVWNKCSSQQFLRSSSYQKKLLVHVM
jgi:pyruvate-formate lyase